MFKTFKTSFLITKATQKNQFVYFLSNIPLLGDFFTYKSYSSKVFKFLTDLYTYLALFFSIFIYKIIYYVALLALLKGATSLEGYKYSVKAIHFLTFMALNGIFLNNQAMEIKEDTYFGIFLLRFDAKKYMISNYGFFLIKYFVGTLAVGLPLFVLLFKLPLSFALVFPVYCVFTKVIGECIFLKYNNKYLYSNKREVTYQIIMALCVFLFGIIAAFAFTNINLPMYGFYVLFILLIVPFILSVRFLFKFDNYKQVYKVYLSPDVINMKNTGVNKVELDNCSSYLEEGKGDKKRAVKANSSKEGYDYFNDIFMQRHKKLLIKPIIIISLIVLVIAIAAPIIIYLAHDKELLEDVNQWILNGLPVFLFIMYFIHRGERITKAMYINCDCAMLNYRFYREPKALIKIFFLRLKMLNRLNLIPSLIIAFGLEATFIVSGGTDKYIFYLLIFVGIIAMNMIFSIHYLFLYYILQPYNDKMQMKSATYGIMTYITYFACYMFMSAKLPTFSFCLVLIGVAIIYYGMAIFLIYKFGTKTFRVRN